MGGLGDLRLAGACALFAVWSAKPELANKAAHLPIGAILLFIGSMDACQRLFYLADQIKAINVVIKQW